MGLRTEKPLESKLLSQKERIVIGFISLGFFLYFLKSLICPQLCVPSFDEKTPTIIVADQEQIPKFSPTETHYEMIFSNQNNKVAEMEMIDLTTVKNSN